MDDRFVRSSTYLSPEVLMVAIPHDIFDLYFAPVVLALEARIDELGSLPPEQLAKQVGLASDKADWTRDLREAGLLEAVRHLIDCHHWELSWDARGVRMTHGDHKLVLGVPATFVEFLSGTTSVAGDAVHA
jgi:hypothetical protein